MANIPDKQKRPYTTPSLRLIDKEEVSRRRLEELFESNCRDRGEIKEKEGKNTPSSLTGK